MNLKKAINKLGITVILPKTKGDYRLVRVVDGEIRLWPDYKVENTYRVIEENDPILETKGWISSMKLYWCVRSRFRFIRPKKPPVQGALGTEDARLNEFVKVKASVFDLRISNDDVMAFFAEKRVKVKAQQESSTLKAEIERLKEDLGDRQS